MSGTKQAQSDQWKPVRVHAMFRRFRRGPDKKKRFVGQQEGEVIRRIVREHPIFSVESGLPLLIALAFLAVVVWLETRGAVPGPIFAVLYPIAFIAILGAGLYCAYRIFELWWVNIDVITNKRILTWHGLLKNPTRNEVAQEKVQQVEVEQETLLQILLNYGTLHVYVAGGKPLVMKNVYDPKGVRDSIEGVRESYKKAKAAAKPSAPENETQEEALTRLGKHDPLPSLPDADAKYVHRQREGKLRGPLRRFGGPLRITCDVHYEADEKTVMYVTRSIWVLVVRLVPVVLLLLASLVGALIAPVHFGLFAIAFVVLLVVAGLVTVSYLDDVFILTNKRIIDINRKLIILSEEHVAAGYDKITKIEVNSPNVILLALSIGNLHILTPGTSPDIHMLHIAHPFYVQDKIYEIQGFKEKYKKAEDANKQKDTLKLWFSTMLGTIETKVVNRGIPNLQSLDLWEAVERASALGMSVIPIGESDSYPNVESGRIVMQIPPPGTVLEATMDTHEKPQIQVILSKRN